MRLFAATPSGSTPCTRPRSLSGLIVTPIIAPRDRHRGVRRLDVHRRRSRSTCPCSTSASARRSSASPPRRAGAASTEDMNALASIGLAMYARDRARDAADRRSRSPGSCPCSCTCRTISSGERAICDVPRRPLARGPLPARALQQPARRRSSASTCQNLGNFVGTVLYAALVAHPAAAAAGWSCSAL